ncbi:TonB-dependent receptor [Stenotrophomonas maltophilia group sp. msm1]|uniref:TonB-dependent receptor domain-containing protein n=1 Tax=Stenotrophomonas maltophilia group sp. msm1 TaxID=3061099 RepID=UPI0028962175|nr:TonB-dependent receptor [Stenotrophomonas maltophilia group sp. msm1]MDT3558283.1 TonB-dependent receptor [Stenotrophomonas maltophilia group sp. msm1]
MAQRHRVRSSLSRTLLTSAVLAAMTAPALAHGDASGAPQTLDKVVVTASGFEQKVVDAPASISVVSREELSKRPYTNLVDALRDVEGIDVGLEATDKNGRATISMRGLPSEYTLVLIDGRRQSNVGQLYPNNFGGGQFAYLPPLDAIERIEVVRGPMSTLYGSDAMGGVINIITRRNQDRWHGAVTQGFTVQQDDQFGDARTTGLYLSGPLLKDRLSLAVRGSYYDAKASNPEWDALTLPDGSLWERSIGFGGGGKSVANTNWNTGVRLDFRVNDDHELWLDYDVSRQKYDNSEGQTGTLDSLASLWRVGNAVIPNPSGSGTVTRRVVQPRVGYTAYQRYERDQLSLTHQGRYSFGTWQTSLTHSKSSNLGRSLPLTLDERANLQTLWNDVCRRTGAANNCAAGRGNALTALNPSEMARLRAFLPRPLRTMELEGYVLDTMLDLDFDAHTLTVGGQYNDTDMIDGVFGMDGAGYRSNTKQKHRMWALFAEDNWALTDSLTATFGLRYDDHNVFGSHVSPRGYLVWNASDAWTFKGGVSTGYKTPRPDQLFPGITGFGGQGVLPLVGSPNLKPETSTNYELAAYYEGQRWGFNVTGFFNTFEDKIASGGTFPNCEVAPAGSGYCVDIGPGWAALGYSTFTQSVNIDKAETRGAELAAHVDLLDTLQLRGNYTWTRSEQTSGAQKGLPISGTTPAKHMANASLNWQINEALSLSLIGEGRYDRYRDTLLDANGASHTRYYEDYTIFHLGGSWKATPWLTVNARVNNLLDKDFVSQSCLLISQSEFNCVDDYATKDQRRSYWISLNAKF